MRSTSALVTPFLATSAIVASIAFRTSSGFFPGNDRRHEHHHARIVQGRCSRDTSAAFFVSTSDLYKPARRIVGENLREHFARRKVRLRRRPGRDRSRQRRPRCRPGGAARSARRPAAALRCRSVELAVRARDRAEVFDDSVQRLFRLELAGDHQHRIIGLVIAGDRTRAGSRSARARCRPGCRSSICRSCAIRRPSPSSAA